jgi:DNA-binding response OmpR family regulator
MPEVLEPGGERPPRLLIVDDVATNRDLMARRFGAKGFDIVQAESGREALFLIEAQPFDTVLLDVMMPDMDGLEVLSRIRAKFAPAALPVIMVTAMTQSSDVVRALNLGANDYLTKPMDFAIAHARVSTQVARKQAEDTLERLVDELERAVVAHVRQLKHDADALAQTNLAPGQTAILESLKSSGSHFVRAVSTALQLGGGRAAKRNAA